MGPPSPPPTDTSHSPSPEMQLPPGKQVGSAAGKSGKPLCVGGEGLDRKLEKTLALGHILKPLCSNGKLRPGVWGQRKINLGASKA